MPAEPEVLAEVDPALALRLQVRVDQRAGDELRQFVQVLSGHAPLLSCGRGSKENAPPESLPIGEVARLSGKAPSAIRYYEEVGLVEALERISGRRRYLPTVVRTLAVIETAQRAGLSLDEIRLLLEATPSNHAATEQLREVAEQKLPLLREAIERAELVRRWLEDAARCHCPTLDDCPLFEDPEGLPERSLVLR